MLKIYNTISRKKEVFKPVQPNNIGIYVCGVTVSNLCHIGHARTFIFFDILVRYLKYCGYKINYIRNITDIDDKIIKKSIDYNESIKNFTSRMIKHMYQDFLSLDILPPNKEPKVTENIKEIIKIIKKIISLNYAYISKNGDVMFHINKFKNYGKLSLQKINKLNSNNVFKENVIDFALWKISKSEEPGWPSPWGKGRPGWHIECSTINQKYLKNFDIHGGGSDLIFPHHENEIAQSMCINEKYFNYWMHTGMVIINNKKMSKSLDNFFTIKKILKFYDSETIRYFLMSKHYRSPIIFNKKNIVQAHLSLSSLYNCLIDIDIKKYSLNNSDVEKFEDDFKKAMNDDLNIPKTYSILFNMMHKINKLKVTNINKAKILACKLKELANILGLLQKDSKLFFNNVILKDKKKIENIKRLILLRDIARKNKNWKQADIIRNKLEEIGVVLSDKSHKTTWKQKN